MSDRVFIASFGVPRYLVLKSYEPRISRSAPIKVQWLSGNVTDDEHGKVARPAEWGAVRYAVLFLFLISVCGAQPSLSVKGNTYEGSALFLTLTNCFDENSPTAEIEGKTYEFLPGGEGSWELVLPISTESGGPVQLAVKCAEETFERKFQVQSRNYGHQSITLNPSTLAGYDDPRNKADDKKILDALESD